MNINSITQLSMDNIDNKIPYDYTTHKPKIKDF